MATLLLLSGPPKAGKSRLRGDFFNLLRSGAFAGRWFIEVLSPDSEGAWVNDAWAIGRGPQAEAMARSIKNVVKTSGHFFSPAFVRRKAAQLAGLCRWADLVIGDLGGVPSPENRSIIGAGAAGADRIVPVILLGPAGDGGWTRFWEDFGLSPITTTYYDGLAQDLLRQATGE